MECCLGVLASETTSSYCLVVRLRQGRSRKFAFLVVSMKRRKNIDSFSWISYYYYLLSLSLYILFVIPVILKFAKINSVLMTARM